MRGQPGPARHQATSLCRTPRRQGKARGFPRLLTAVLLGLVPSVAVPACLAEMRGGVTPLTLLAVRDHVLLPFCTRWRCPGPG